MNISIKQYEKISHFLDAEMTMAEMEAFEKELSANPEMREQLNFEQALRDGFAVGNIKAQERNLQNNEAQAKIHKIGADLKQAFDNKEYSSKKINPHRPLWKKTIGRVTWLHIAAAAVVLIIIATFFIVKPKQSAQQTPLVKLNEKPIIKNIDSSTTVKSEPNVMPAKDPDFASLYKKYFVKDQLPETYPMLLADAFSNYERGDYASIQHLNLSDISEVRGEDELNNKQNILQLGHYYKGIAFLETNNTQQAIINFNWVIKNQPGKSLHLKAQWYLTLAYLKENNGTKAAELCKSVINNRENEALAKNAQALFGAIKNKIYLSK